MNAGGSTPGGELRLQAGAGSQVSASRRQPAMRLDAFFQRLWYSQSAPWLVRLLTPLAWLFGAVAAARRVAYRSGLFRKVRVSRPVIVIGNITVGGVGKTPLTIWLASQIAARGIPVGIVLRGYGGQPATQPRVVTPDSAAAEVGDEAVLLALRTGAIVVVGRDRAAAAQCAIARGAQIVIADDGLQHYRLARDCEIAVIDERRGLGNARLLPAGPLREPRSRLQEVDLVVWTRRTSAAERSATTSTQSVTAMARIAAATSLTSGETRPLAAFRGTPIHAIAAIGSPQGFFDALAAAGLTVDGRALPDHAALTPADTQFADDAPVLMTEKDAVKCRSFADSRLWAVRLDLELSAADAATVNAIVDRALAGGVTDGRRP